jgi:hypothetical protein
MIIMLNGSFGVGKSSVASELKRIIPNSMIYNPEIIGTGLRYLTEGRRAPHEQTGDFQDIRLWPTLTVATAEHLFRLFRRTLIVPMTLANPVYLTTIRNGLTAISPPLYHFCLVASLDTIQQRLQTRDEDISWSWNKAQEYVPLFGDPQYSIHIDTEEVTIAQVADLVARYIADNPAGSNQRVI